MTTAALLGSLVGHMLDPIIWGPVLIVFFTARKLTWPARLGVALAVVLAIHAVLAAIIPGMSVARIVNGIVYGVLGAAVWFAIFESARVMFARIRR